MKSIKSKTLGLLFALAMGMLPIIWPQTISKAQPVLEKSKIPARNIVDSLEREKDKALDSAIQVASTLPEMSNRLTKYIRKNSFSKPKTVFLKPEVVARYNGMIYDINPEAYKGYLIIDIDKFIREVDTAEIEAEDVVDTLPNTQPVPKKRGWLYRLFHKNNY